jgi:hypothetical protein
MNSFSNSIRRHAFEHDQEDVRGFCVREALRLRRNRARLAALATPCGPKPRHFARRVRGADGQLLVQAADDRLRRAWHGERPGDEQEAPRSDGETRHPFESRRQRRREQGGIAREEVERKGEIFAKHLRIERQEHSRSGEDGGSNGVTYRLGAGQKRQQAKPQQPEQRGEHDRIVQPGNQMRGEKTGIVRAERMEQMQQELHENKRGEDADGASALSRKCRNSGRWDGRCKIGFRGIVSSPQTPAL